MTVAPVIEPARPRELMRKNRTLQRVVERLIEFGLLACGLLSIAVTLTIAGVILYGSFEFFATDDGQWMAPAQVWARMTYFFTGTEWTAVFSNPSYGIWPLLTATLMIAVMAAAIALPIGVMTAICLSEYATPRLRSFAKPTLELLAGIPTVVYGFFALTAVTPALSSIVPGLGNPYNLLSAGIVVGIMIIPMVASLSEDALRAVPRSLRDGAIALGANRFDTSVKVVLPAALSGVIASFLLAIARAIGETMAVALAAGETARLTLDPRQGAMTMTSFIVRIAKGEVVHGSTDYNSLFAVAGAVLHDAAHERDRAPGAAPLSPGIPMTALAPQPWNPPAPTFVERLQAAMLRTAVAALVLSLLFVLSVFLIGMVGVNTGDRDDFPDIRTVIPFGGLLAAVLFAMLAPTLLLLSTRPMQDRAFTLAGFLAAFFGLAMLVVFFAQLAADVTSWFEYMPRLIERENQRLLEAPKHFEKEQLAIVYRELNDELAKIDTDAAKSDTAKKADKATMKALFENELIPDKKKDIDLTIQEMDRAAQRDLRTGTSPPALFWYFLTHGPAPIDQPQEAGIWYALLGSLWVGLITILFAVPVGVGAAVYLEEYRGDSWLSRLIQVNINNLAGVPSVVYGILGSFVFVGLIFRPLENDSIAARNVIGGGLTLGLLTLPVIIVAAQEAIRAVPGSIRQGAVALGATRWQTTWRTVLPMALPGILTGTILSLSRAIGEAAPLILFGALLYVDQAPSLFGRFTVLPMQIFSWAGRPPITMPNGESIDAWKGNAAMASVVLLLALLTMNSIAIYLRNRTQGRSRY